MQALCVRAYKDCKVDGGFCAYNLSIDKKIRILTMTFRICLKKVKALIVPFVPFVNKGFENGCVASDKNGYGFAKQ